MAALETPREAPDDADLVRTSVASSTVVKFLAILVMVAGGLLAAGGLATWVTVQGQLVNENITVADDAAMFAGEVVDGPFTAWAQADVIDDHARAASDGFTYAELDSDDPRREVVMTASFLRASLFTSVVSFGLAVMAMGLGIVFVVIGLALQRISWFLPRNA